jgi:hypothetical protein
VPTRAEVEYQLANAEALELRFCDSTLGWRTLTGGPTTGLVQDNTFVADRKSVRATGVDTLRLYGVFFADADQDDARSSCDCADGNGTIWAPPGPAGMLTLSKGAGGTATLSWSAPVFLGGTVVRYDTVRSTDRADFVTSAVCVEGNGTDTTATDATNPALGQAFYYLISPENDCPSDPGCFDPGAVPTTHDCT